MSASKPLTRWLASVAAVRRIALALLVFLGSCVPVHAADRQDQEKHLSAQSSPPRHPGSPHGRSLTDTRVVWPSWEKFTRVVLLRDSNTSVVLQGTFILGVSAGVVGTFLLLRKRALVGDVIGHASLPGIAIAFLVMESLDPGSGRSLPGLLMGAAAAGILAALATVAIGRCSRIKQDAALAVVLGVAYGLGIALFTVIQKIPTGNAAGLNEFLFGGAHNIIEDDVKLNAAVALFVLLFCGLLFKEFSLICFDQEFAAAQGWPVAWIDALLMLLVVAVSVIGMQSVGLVLVVALLIIPAAAARFWTDNLLWMTLASAAFGGASAYLGVMTSALFPRLAAGAVIVLVGSALFFFSMMFGARRGIVRRMIAHRRLKHRVGRHDLLRAFYEAIEPRLKESPSEFHDLTSVEVSLDRLLAMRTWTPRRLSRLLAAARREGLLRCDGVYCLTDLGQAEAVQTARNHRLWEIYLVTHADIAPSHVDRDADQIEHILDPQLMEELESLLAEQYPHMVVPPSPHEIAEVS